MIIQRAILAYLTFSGLLVGVWATFFPQSFYDDFPGAGRVWVAVDGPYNEHLVRDVGQLSLAIALVSGVAAWTMIPVLVRVAAAAWLGNAVPLRVPPSQPRHVRHVRPGRQHVSLGLLVALPIVVLVLSYRQE